MSFFLCVIQLFCAAQSPRQRELLFPTENTVPEQPERLCQEANLFFHYLSMSNTARPAQWPSSTQVTILPATLSADAKVWKVMSKEAKSLHRHPLSEDVKAQWIYFIIEWKCTEMSPEWLGDSVCI